MAIELFSSCIRIIEIHESGKWDLFPRDNSLLT